MSIQKSDREENEKISKKNNSGEIYSERSFAELNEKDIEYGKIDGN
jgi:hypothetical protein